jgi:hypothetical protein
MEADGPELLDHMKAENAVTEQALKSFASQHSAFCKTTVGVNRQ